MLRKLYIGLHFIFQSIMNNVLYTCLLYIEKTFSLSGKRRIFVVGL